MRPDKASNKALEVIVVIGILVAIIGLVIFINRSTPREKSWDQKFNDEVSDIDVNLGSAVESPAFEFHLNEQSPHFSLILCKGAKDDERMQKDSWDKFFNQIARYGPFESYKPEFTDQETADGKQQARIMMFINLRRGADTTTAIDVGRKVANVMREVSPCK